MKRRKLVQTEMSVLLEDYKGATFSECRKYRYALWRIWDKNKPLVMFIGLNPSTANEFNDDPTIRRVKSFAKQWGYGGVYMTNLFGFISTNPAKLQTTNVVNEIENHDHLKAVADCCKEVICAWGSFPAAIERGKQVKACFPGAKALIINNDGTPRHPLYVPGDVVPVNF